MRNVKTGFHILRLKFFFFKKNELVMPRGQKDEGISLVQDRVIEVMTNILFMRFFKYL